MSNQTLINIITGMLLVIAIVVGVIKFSSKDSENKNLVNKTETKQNNTVEENKNTAIEKPQTEARAACSRQFSQETLKTANVNIEKRQAEINVIGFGKITVEFFEKDAPKTVENFLRLANAGYFDCLTFHRVAKGFVIQGGDPTGIGSGGDSAFGGEFADEINPESELYQTGYKKGVLAMANRGPNTNTSQFFIMLSDAGLPPAYTIFGRVINGIDIVDTIGQVEINSVLGPTDGSPKQPVVMESVKIIK